MTTKKLEYIGSCAVDSGQLLITDPCYIDSEWQKTEFEDVRRYQDKHGKIYQYLVDFNNYEDKVNGDTPNNYLERGDWTPIDNPINREYSYNGCCSVTLGEKIGELSFKSGHGGAGIAIGTNTGDGQYPVYVERHEDGKQIKRVIIELDCWDN